MAYGAEPRSTALRVRSARFGIGTSTAAALFATASLLLHDLGFERAAVSAGEYWRLATCHMAHLDIRHALTNAVGTGLVTTILLEFHRVPYVLGSAAAIAAVISAASLVLFGESNHAGFSGVLYGLAAMAAFGLATRSPCLAAIIAVALVAGIFTAFFGWSRPWSADVAVHTHVCGMATGAAIGGWRAAIVSRRGRN